MTCTHFFAAIKFSSPHLSGYLLQSSPADAQISRDIYRTFSDHPFFTHKPVQRCIGRILHAWSLFNPSVSYVQGHNCVAALFLMVTLNEELAFKCFIAFLAHPIDGMQTFYADGLKVLLQHASHIDAMLRSQCPALHAHLAKHGLDPLAYVTPFYLTGFTHHLALESCVFIFDFLLMSEIDHCSLPPIDAANPKDAALCPSRISSRITHLTLALMAHQEKDLIKLKSVEDLFKTLQKLHCLKDERSRKKVFQRALKKAVT